MNFGLITLKASLQSNCSLIKGELGFNTSPDRSLYAKYWPRTLVHSKLQSNSIVHAFPHKQLYCINNLCIPLHSL